MIEIEGLKREVTSLEAKRQEQEALLGERELNLAILAGKERDYLHKDHERCQMLGQKEFSNY